jgi:ADP-heptose:LPS heptosyltransferase
MTVETLGERLTANPDGFREMAAIMEALDLMIISDSGPAHLAGALGRPAWIALRDAPDWRWQLERTDTPWYPTLRLFRQQTRGAWEPVFETIAAALADEVARRNG